MIDIKYKNVYEEFIKEYEEIHVNPWHEITKMELNKIYDFLIENMDITDEYSFKYFMDYIIKRLSGIEDAHTAYYCSDLIPYFFKVIDDEIFVNYPDGLKGYSLVSINGVSIDIIINELGEVITYGTEGKRTFEIENSLFNRIKMFGIPSFRGKDKLIYKLKDKNGNNLNIIVTKEEKYDNPLDFEKYMYGNNAKYKIIDNCLIYSHSSVQLKYKELIEETIKKLEKEDLDNIKTIIIDIRGNTGGYSKLNQPLMEFLKKHADKKLICLCDYRVFSGGRFALRDLIKLGAITIGEGIGTPINCYGNSRSCIIDNHRFVISSCYFNLCKHIQLSSKEEFSAKITDDIRTPHIFVPDIEVKQTKDDYLNGVDTILNYALEYGKTIKKM